MRASMERLPLATNPVTERNLPSQGRWRDEDYLGFTDHARRLVEFTDGCIEKLPVPTDRHHRVLGELYRLFFAWLGDSGVVHFAGVRLRIREGKYREPDLLLLCDRTDGRRQNRFWLGADLVMEVVSPDDPNRDWITKRADYAEAGIPEYWIVDPIAEAITVLELDGPAYAEHGAFGLNARATSPLLPGFAVDVAALFQSD
ncbi:MAG: Uma2 family endonuclease [Gammaproteobacteria bacterium]|nr:Uma2 family endonuclease [Gammaproteobacteria bacterium]